MYVVFQDENIYVITRYVIKMVVYNQNKLICKSEEQQEAIIVLGI